MLTSLLRPGFIVTNLPFLQLRIGGILKHGSTAAFTYMSRKNDVMEWYHIGTYTLSAFRVRLVHRWRKMT